ncbi:MAG: biotin--[acetyl-CoA-carboxylase] ligase [Candidatus Omnitrophica bacterium]|nr:biotin--[acetyl-CoA-carboxylase] ligase [Candidatus Omnitrophota bacterium]MDD5771502.1 biotin--[acetyl-CoA-carboxylase] ligase [Candidatus Omnitrophota bacterium]
MKEKILEHLKKGHEYISGDEIASRLGISRQGLWKHIQELKDSGYDIVAVPHLGYRLESSPDRLSGMEVSHGLNTKFIARKIHYFDYLSSTMDFAMQLGMDSAPCGTVVIAESQTKGRGRLGRSWFSPKYKGIYFSLILRPEIAPSASPILTLLNAVSICESVKNICGLDARIKWPNDVFVNGRKIAGILTEINAEMDKINFVVIGIGLNVNNDKRSLVAQATSLKEQLGHSLSRVALFQELLRRIEDNYILMGKEGSGPIIEKWRNFNLTLGGRIKVHFQDRYIEGQAIGIDSDGSLLIRKDAGLVQKIFSGDILHLR